MYQFSARHYLEDYNKKNWKQLTAIIKNRKVKFELEAEENLNRIISVNDLTVSDSKGVSDTDEIEIIVNDS